MRDVAMRMTVVVTMATSGRVLMTLAVVTSCFLLAHPPSHSPLARSLPLRVALALVPPLSLRAAQVLEVRFCVLLERTEDASAADVIALVNHSPSPPPSQSSPS